MTFAIKFAMIHKRVRKNAATVCGCGGIGRHARLRIWCARMQVQVLSSAPKKAYRKSFRFESTGYIRSYRGVAQMVARLVRDQEVVGSNPVTPTKDTEISVSFFFFPTKKCKTLVFLYRICYNSYILLWIEGNYFHFFKKDLRGFMRSEWNALPHHSKQKTGKIHKTR